MFCVFKAIAILPLASATVIQYTYPTFTAIAAWLLLGESIHKRIIIAVLLGWLGVVMTAGTNFNIFTLETENYIYVCIALAGAILTALAYVTVRKLSIKEHPLVIVYYFPLISIPITLPLVLAKGVMPIGIEWIFLLGIGLFTQLGQIWITKGLSLLPAAQASSINYTQVIFAAIWGVLIFSEFPND